MKNEQKRKTIAFDFDGVIAEYKGYQGSDRAGDPRKQVVEAIRKLKKNGYTIIIHSTRGNDFLKKYCSEHNIPIDFFNENPHIEGPNKGKPIAQVYIDDHALHYHGQNSESLIKEIEQFKIYWEEK